MREHKLYNFEILYHDNEMAMLLCSAVYSFHSLYLALSSYK